MAEASTPRIHPTAIISAESELAPDVFVGANCVLEGHVRLGPQCRLEAKAYLFGPLVLGRGNHVYGQAVLGEQAQHLQAERPQGLEIGDGNTFRPRVTVHQGMLAATRIGNGNHFFAGAHVAHDCQVGDHCVFAGNALLGGHCVMGDRVRLGRGSGVHQYCRLGRLARLHAASLTTKDVPPFIVQRWHNRVVGVNGVSMRRAGLPREQVVDIERLYQIVYRRGLTLPVALAAVEKELGYAGVLGEYLAFVRSPGRGITR